MVRLRSPQVAGLSIKNFARRGAPRGPFARIARAVLPGWDISLVFVGERRARKLNEALRGKSYIPNVLSYETTPNLKGRSKPDRAVPSGALAKSGEVVICPAAALREAPSYSLPPAAYILYLFIHGLLHLKGMRHGVTMEKRERALLVRFARARFPAPLSSSTPHGSTRRHRHRHRHVPGQAGRRRRSH